MNLRKLETFYWAAKLSSFTAAAKRLNATQSTVSMRIQELEREFDVTLFDRSQRTVKVTEIGRDLMQYAERLLAISAEMRGHIAAPETTPGTLRLGVAEIVCMTWLPRLVKEVHIRYPKVRLELEEALTRDLVRKLDAGTLDLILAPGLIPGHNFSPLSLGTVDVAWMASPNLELPDRTLTPLDLQKWPIIALSKESYHHASIEDWFQSANSRCMQIDTCKSMGVAASLVISGLGVTLLPVKCFQDELASGRLRIVDAAPAFPPVEFMASGARNSFNTLTRLIASLAQQVSDFHDVPRDCAVSPGQATVTA